MSSKIYFILPVYNELESIMNLVKGIVALQKKITFKIRIIIVDDGSALETKKYLEKCKELTPLETLEILTHSPNKGLPQALMTGFNHIKDNITEEDIVVTMDGDNTHTPNLVPEMLKKIKLGADIVIASRYQSGASIQGLSYFRIFLSTGARFLYTLFWGFKNVRDYTCLFRMHSGTIIKKFFSKKGSLFLAQKGFACTTELLSLFNELEAKFDEVPISLVYSNKKGESNMKIWKTIITSLKIILLKGR